MEKLLNILFPPKCVFCGSIGSVFCAGCLNCCEPVEADVCILCQRPSAKGRTHEKCLTFGMPAFLFSCFQYDGIVRDCIRVSKYSRREFSVLRELTEFGVMYTRQLGVYFKGYVLVPIPLYKKKELKRGFNHTDVIAKELRKGFNLHMDAKILKRVKPTLSQYKFSRKERKENLKNAFVSKAVGGAKVLLIDDICTTGATLIEASRALYKSGASEVGCFTLSRVI